MSQIIINDETYEGQPGERLVDIARDNGTHFGFLCDGVGFCQMCACRVIEGDDSLNDPTESEQNWLNESLMEQGYRLACQASVRGPGPIRVVSRAEEVRRKVMAIYFPPEGTNPIENMGDFANYMSGMVMNQLGRFPFNVFDAVSIATKNTPRTPNVGKILGDVGKVVTNNLPSFASFPSFPFMPFNPFDTSSKKDDTNA